MDSAEKGLIHIIDISPQRQAKASGVDTPVLGTKERLKEVKRDVSPILRKCALYGFSQNFLQELYLSSKKKEPAF